MLPDREWLTRNITVGREPAQKTLLACAGKARSLPGTHSPTLRSPTPAQPFSFLPTAAPSQGQHSCRAHLAWARRILPLCPPHALPSHPSWAQPEASPPTRQGGAALHETPSSMALGQRCSRAARPTLTAPSRPRALALTWPHAGPGPGPCMQQALTHSLFEQREERTNK